MHDKLLYCFQARNYFRTVDLLVGESYVAKHVVFVTEMTLNLPDIRLIAFSQ